MQITGNLREKKAETSSKCKFSNANLLADYFIDRQFLYGYGSLAVISAHLWLKHSVLFDFKNVRKM